jgi:subtilisin family serine protease
MRYWGVKLLATACLLAWGLPSSAAGIETIHIQRHRAPGFIGYVPDQIVVRVSKETAASFDRASLSRGRTGLGPFDRVGETFGAVTIRPQFPGAGAREKNDRQGMDLSGWHKIAFEGDVDLDAVVTAYRKRPEVLDVQPIGIHTTCATPNDGYFSSQWHLSQNSDADMDMPEAWDGQTGDADVVVAVLDTGVRYFHKDLGGSGVSYSNPSGAEGNMWINTAERDGTSDADDDGNGYVDDWIGWDFVNGANSCWSGEDCDDPDNDPRDFNGHGTHCAGNVAAITNNGYAVAGPAGGWGSGSQQAAADGVRIMALRVGWSADYYGSEVGYVRMDYVAEALYYAADNGANIASCSWESSNTGGLAAAVDYFLNSGGILFKAAGNDDSSSADYMCGRGDVICVAATDEDDCKAEFSNYGSWVKLSAPGVDIYSLYHLHSDEDTDYMAQSSGTSMATPLAAGVAALVWSAHPSWTAQEVEDKLLASADAIDSLTCNADYAGELGSGRINAYQAIYADTDGDGTPDWDDGCPEDPGKTDPGVCGCGVADTDTDGDGLYDCVEDAYGTDSDAADTDGDGIDDGDEVAYWGEDWDADPDADGMVNLLDMDSDNDGFTDGDEIDGGTDPSNPASHPLTVDAMPRSGALLTLLLLSILGAAWLQRKHA